MNSFNELPHLTIIPGLELILRSSRITHSKKNVSLSFNLSSERVSVYLILDAHDLGYHGRLEILEAFAETMNIYLGQLISKNNLPETLSTPKLLNIDLELDFKDNKWSFFEFHFNESIFPVAIRVDRKQ